MSAGVLPLQPIRIIQGHEAVLTPEVADKFAKYLVEEMNIPFGEMGSKYEQELIMSVCGLDRSSPPQGGSGVPRKRESGWFCSYCDCMNDWETKKCEGCGARRQKEK